MKYKILFAFVLLLAVVIVIDSNKNAFGNAAGAPTGVSGSPADGTTCAQSGCHSGSAVTPITGWITSNIPAGGYTPGQTYQITAKAVYIGRSKFGFEISPQTPSGTIMGTLTSTGSKTSVHTPGWITHTNAGNTGTDSIVWTFNWTAPAAGSGGFIFYGAFNCANGDGNTTGDLIYTSKLAVGEAPSPGVDAGIISITSPSLYTCAGTITPVVKIHNFGTTTFTSATINYMIDANTPATQAWSGSLVTDSSQTVTLPSIAVTSGRHTFTAYTSNPSPGPDTITVNDGKTISFDVKSTTQAIPFSEGFDTVVFPKTGWEINNPNNDTTWRRTTAAFHSGVASAFINNFQYDKPGAKDELITPTFNLAAMSTPVLSFQLAYQLYSNPATAHASDTLEVFITTDCGTTWNQLYKKYGVPLTTATPTFSTTAFKPTASEWHFESVNLAPYASATSAMFKFVNITDYENNLYLDDIRIDNSLGIAGFDMPVSSLLLFPNPASDHLTLNYELSETTPVSVKMYDMQGKEMTFSITETRKAAGTYSNSIDLSGIPDGIYLLHLTAGNHSETRRFTIAR
ncbi:MAG TPA: choice-of-anchor V domain-containing protein [Bacteroidia bacterium]|jgi:hypothetical protein|nr:choice-of-anchor V domain-containing protein [Bacteroidia bacterium]